MIRLGYEKHRRGSVITCFRYLTPSYVQYTDRVRVISTVLPLFPPRAHYFHRVYNAFGNLTVFTVVRLVISPCAQYSVFIYFSGYFHCAFNVSTMRSVFLPRVQYNQAVFRLASSLECCKCTLKQLIFSGLTLSIHWLWYYKAYKDIYSSICYSDSLLWPLIYNTV